MEKTLVMLAAATALGAAAVREAKRSPQLVQSTVDIKVEARHAIDVPVASLVAAALAEFMTARPSARMGKFETKDGLDVSWTVTDMLVDESGVPIPAAIARSVAAINLATVA